MLPYITASLLAVVIIVLLYPIWRYKRLPLAVGDTTLADEALVAQSLEKENILQRLSQLEIEKAAGKFTDDDYQHIKQIEERRLVSLLDMSVAPPPPQPAPGLSPVKRPWGMVVAIGIWIAAGAMAVSSLVYGKISKSQMAAPESAPAPGMPPINPEEMVARLKARLEKNPNDLQGQMMLGRSYMVLERWEAAETAWRKALELDERNPTAHASLGEALLRSHPPGDKPTAEEALTHFDKALIAAPQDPSILWARGIVLIALARFSEADESWTTAYQALTPETPEAKMVKDALSALRSGKIKSP